MLQFNVGQQDQMFSMMLIFIVSIVIKIDRCFGDDETRSEATSSSEKRCLERYEQEILHSLQRKMAEEQRKL